jgi:UDP-N-acetylmuramate: L-alanyl-gamma-D-glutamyl-meso-diaminopimelate ligase
MGSLAGLFAEAGHRVTGSDAAFLPPMSDALDAWGIERRVGYDPAHLIPSPDLVVVGNVCRPEHPEARSALDAGLRVRSFPAALAEHFLEGRRPLVVAGTHGKTTTASLLAYLLEAADQAPGFLIGGVPLDFGRSARRGDGDAFVVEGDEYDSAFFEKHPKLWQYRAAAGILTSVEHDHVDIYPEEESYREAFRGWIARLPEDGVLVAWAGSAAVRELAAEAPCRVVFYALEEDDVGDAAPVWVGAPHAPRGGATPFELFVGGSATRTAFSPLSGKHNVRNALAALALAAEAEGAPLDGLLSALRTFRGVRRRQELWGTAGGVRVYDDFAHHPSAVALTLDGLARRHPEGRLHAVFEPRSATASRRLHQARYVAALSHADRVIVTPTTRTEIPEGERLDPETIASELTAAGIVAEVVRDRDAVPRRLVRGVSPKDSIVFLSNGATGEHIAEVLTRLAIGIVDDTPTG